MSMWSLVTEHGVQVRFEPGDTLIHHGAPSSACYAILAGEVLVSTVSSSGSTVVLARRGAGALVGEQAALDGLPRSATVHARTAVDAVVLRSDQLEELLLEHPATAVAQLRALSEELRSLTERYAIRGDELRERILNLLETHADTTGSASFESTREELAGFVGATREAVSRALRDLAAEGKVTLDRGSVTLQSTAM